jgi:hypothetical protein
LLPAYTNTAAFHSSDAPESARHVLPAYTNTVAFHSSDAPESARHVFLNQDHFPPESFFLFRIAFFHASDLFFKA